MGTYRQQKNISIFCVHCESSLCLTMKGYFSFKNMMFKIPFFKISKAAEDTINATRLLNYNIEKIRRFNEISFVAGVTTSCAGMILGYVLSNKKDEKYSMIRKMR